MKALRMGLLTGLMGLVLSVPGHSQWLDNFDSYSPGGLVGQSQWELFNKGDASVAFAQFFTSPHSARIGPDTQVLYDMANTSLGARPTKGQWTLSVKTFILGSDSGNARFKMLNDYPNNPNWSVNIDFDLDRNQLKDKATGSVLPILNDEWVTLLVCIDLDRDLYTMYYGDQLLALDTSWSSGLGAAGKVEIAMVELTSLSNLSAMYYDDCRLDKTTKGGCLALVSAGNPATSGNPLTLTASSPSLAAGDQGAVFIWTVNGSLFASFLLLTSYDALGQWSLTAPTPPGLSGIQVGLKAFAFPSVGYLLTSNEDVIVFL